MTTTTTIQQPPEFLQDYYAALAERGMNLGNLGFTPYSQDRVAPWNQQQESASQMIQNRALYGSPEMSQASDWFANMLSGGLNVGNAQASFGPSSIASGGTLTPGTNPFAGMNNPYLNQAINRAQDDVQTRINSQFGNNAFGSTAHQQTLARELGNVSNNMRMQDYGQQMGLAENAVNRGMAAQQFNIGNQNALNQFNANLGFQNAGIANNFAQFNNANQQANIARQQSALGFAPTFAANDYADAQAMMGLGNQLQSYNQDIANANYQEFLRQQAWPGQQLNWMSQGLTGQPGGTSTTTSPDQSSTLANVAGSALTGASLGNYFDNPWLGAGIGSLAGLLL